VTEAGPTSHPTSSPRLRRAVPRLPGSLRGAGLGGPALAIRTHACRVRADREAAMATCVRPGPRHRRPRALGHVRSPAPSATKLRQRASPFFLPTGGRTPRPAARGRARFRGSGAGGGRANALRGPPPFCVSGGAGRSAGGGTTPPLGRGRQRARWAGAGALPRRGRSPPPLPRAGGAVGGQM